MKSLFADGVGLVWEDWGDYLIRLNVGPYQVRMTVEQFQTLSAMLRFVERETCRG